ncbi:NRDE family protein [Blastococcus tunisiensis]|uniref:Transport and Golgi organisation 2 n=1 Tax=Blastococcus tunisiensis TaxID=1798228 RepID=A0A1I2DUR9_9ACTN|nr:NRDE family protein [Blastococcus sp. DSM 46838]SFE84335.1 Transport and Golgi organisation 2 [Blastococcus sp. DSM 46838]
MCTVVVRRSAGGPAEILAVRDEVTSREFDVPDRWWPESPDLVGGRDRVAGGTWCATHVGTGVTALVVNRYHERPATPGAASRGVLPLLAAVHGTGWTSHVRLAGMAGFLLVLVAPDRLVTWEFDGDRLTAAEHADGTHLLTSGGPEDRKADRWLAAFTEAAFPEGWRDLVRGVPPSEDPGALVVRRERDGQVYGTVFAETIDARPGRVELEYALRPWTHARWDTATFTSSG